MSSQRTDEWKQDRLGVITGTRAHNLLQSPATRNTLLAELVKEYAIAQWKDFAPTKAMERGSNIEDEAISYYQVLFDSDVYGDDSYIISKDNPQFACSPDGLIGKDGGLEIKRLDEENHIKVLVSESPEKKYIHQIEWCLFVTGREWWDYFGYCETLPETIKHYRQRITLPDERKAEITKISNNFLTKLQATLERLDLTF